MGIVAHGCGVHLRAALGTKGMRALSAAIGCLHIHFRRAAEQAETAFFGEHDHAKRRTAEHLAVSTVADDDLARINVGHVGDVTTMTTSIDVHPYLPV